MKKIYLSITLTFFFLCTFSMTVAAKGYNYTPLEDVIYSAEAMNVTKVVDSSNLLDELGQPVSINFGELVDVFSYQNRIYLVDKSNSLIHLLNQDFQYITSFGQDEAETKLKNPQGIYVTDKGIFIADTGNLRVVIYNHDFTFQAEVTHPDDPTFKQSPEDTTGYDFKPLKIAVHKTGRFYVVADQIFEGILDFNPDGSFSRYVGANTVTLSVWDAFWLKFTTEEQKANQGFRLATTFKNVNIDEMGYLYTVSGLNEGEKVIKKLNYKGIDVLTRNGYVPQSGDMVTVPQNVNVPDGPSEFIDIDMNEFGNYIALDKTRGRIFTYDFEGNLLYVSGQLGNLTDSSMNERDLFLQPSALTYFQDKVVVVDTMNKNVVVFEYTEFGSLVNEATKHYFEGDYEAARDTWEEVLVLNTNYYLAYSGVAKAELREGNYEKAMQYAKLGYDDYTFSSAYKPYRYDKLVVVFPYVIGLSLAGLVYSFVNTIRKSVQKSREEEGDD